MSTREDTNIFAELRRGVVSKSEAETRALARRLALSLPPDCTLALSGDLGAGKTAFVRGLVEAWRTTDRVTSPSFTLCNLYRGDRTVLHLDAYRLDSPDAWDDLMLDDFLVSPWCMVVEWAENVSARLPVDTLWLGIEIRESETRIIRQTPR
ncbi:tRNA (adenosine(37)-N6)-threonylcarbamoyltransferase complex ATPase subunit type 1 TsaE [Opitutales bacterium ASA1]|uniref:tRNA (adenosine(37)-N6)-threonylcarbamoyltransferase complex ATPase subunit type 1 TsaE n=1 Tax=Congregicoccus parvus TaxID=3081749 RepID=UPI002B2880E4|nr:tRNA (adenosine(37)-N6)-threonylcarbamoyltransferase complex ATPase subunit type 1 TsaE [Opitutales bacterium ASA1]